VAALLLARGRGAESKLLLARGWRWEGTEPHEAKGQVATGLSLQGCPPLELRAVFKKADLDRATRETSACTDLLGHLRPSAAPFAL